MNEPSTAWLLAALLLLLLCSAFFSGTETGMMAVNRYRLSHMARKGHRGAMRVSALLEHPDRLIGLILLGNNLVNIMAASVATVIGFRLYGAAGVAAASVILTVVVLIFSELTPKTLASYHPERVSYISSLLLKPLMFLLRPVVACISGIANAILWSFGMRPGKRDHTHMSVEELQSVVREAGRYIHDDYRNMLLRILELQDITVDEIMVARNEVSFINLENNDGDLAEAVRNCRYSHVPVCNESLDNVAGILRTRKLAVLVAAGGSDIREQILANMTEPYFIPEGADLYAQLAEFRNHQRRLGLVVDEYGVVQGLLTMQDILEEIVGEFTRHGQLFDNHVRPLPGGNGYLVDGSASVREVNRKLNWHLPQNGIRTINGLILEHLQDLPQRGVSLRIDDYAFEILKAEGHIVRSASVRDLSVAGASDSRKDD